MYVIVHGEVKVRQIYTDNRQQTEPKMKLRN